MNAVLRARAESLTEVYNVLYTHETHAQACWVKKRTYIGTHKVDKQLGVPVCPEGTIWGLLGKPVGP